MGNKMLKGEKNIEQLEGTMFSQLFYNIKDEAFELWNIIASKFKK